MFLVCCEGQDVGVVRGSGPGWSDIVIGLSLAAPPPVPRGMSVDRVHLRVRGSPPEMRCEREGTWGSLFEPSGAVEGVLEVEVL